MNTQHKSATLATLRYIFREDLIVHDFYSVFEQCSDYVRTLYKDFAEDDIETVVSIAMKLAIGSKA